MPAFRTVASVKVTAKPGLGRINTSTQDHRGIGVVFTGTVLLDGKLITSPKQLKERWQDAARNCRNHALSYAGNNPGDHAARARYEGQGWAYSAAVYALSNSKSAARAADILRQIIAAFEQQAPSALPDEWQQLAGRSMVDRVRLLLAEIETAATVQWMEE